MVEQNIEDIDKLLSDFPDKQTILSRLDQNLRERKMLKRLLKIAEDDQDIPREEPAKC